MAARSQTIISPESRPVFPSPHLISPTKRLGIGHVLALTAACYLVYLFTLSRFVDYADFARVYGDNPPYVALANAIEHWNFSQLHVKLFWGLPYAVSAVAQLTRLANLPALIGLSIAASVVTGVFVYELWGGWVAIAFLILSREWLERSLLGGAEPLFLALLFGAFLMARRQKWEVAALGASLATVVRPMGVFALAGIAIALLTSRQYRKLFYCIAISICIGALYVLPLKLYFGDPMANVKGYGHADWSSASPITYPFAAILREDITGTATTLNMARASLWIIFVLGAAFVMARYGGLRDYAKKRPVEVTFWGLYLLFLFTYNSPWARNEFARFAIPLVPFCCLATERWIPKRYWLLFVLAVLASILSATETVGFLDALGALRRAL